MHAYPIEPHLTGERLLAQRQAERDERAKAQLERNKIVAAKAREAERARRYRPAWEREG